MPQQAGRLQLCPLQSALRAEATPEATQEAPSRLQEMPQGNNTVSCPGSQPFCCAPARCSSASTKKTYLASCRQEACPCHQASGTGCCNREGTCCLGEHYPGPRQQEARLTLPCRQADPHAETTQCYLATCPARPRPQKDQCPTAHSCSRSCHWKSQRHPSDCPANSNCWRSESQASDHPMSSSSQRSQCRASDRPASSNHRRSQCHTPDHPATSSHRRSQRPPQIALQAPDVTGGTSPAATPKHQAFIARRTSTAPKSILWETAYGRSHSPAATAQAAATHRRTSGVPATPEPDCVSPTTSNASIPPEIPPQHPTEGNPDPRDRRQADHATGSKPATDEVEDPEDQQPMVRAATLWQTAWTEELQAAASFDNFDRLVDRLT
ncbi:unnamed protein product [Caretta caretta]